jgi:hypothetical protein
VLHHLQARVLLQELMTLQGPDAASHAAEVILKHMGCGSVRYVAACGRRMGVICMLYTSGSHNTRP